MPESHQYRLVLVLSTMSIHELNYLASSKVVSNVLGHDFVVVQAYHKALLLDQMKVSEVYQELLSTYPLVEIGDLLIVTKDVDVARFELHEANPPPIPVSRRRLLP